ncbi:MAG: 5-(carboxyamino)imidazole ribonucleotide synthase [Saprospiraceae bacterium]
MNKLSQKIGILGGGQLGKMLYQAGSTLGLDMTILEKDDSFPAAQVCPFMVYGDITNYEDVMSFGKECDIITIEIENVNVEALETLEQMGKKVFPQPDILRLIKDKGKQKMFYESAGFPTSDFALHKCKSDVVDEVKLGHLSLPFVQKSRTEGYDGRGVQIINTEYDLNDLFDGETLTEDKVEIDKEISVIVARTPSGKMATFPVVEMQFHPTANLVEFLFSPSELPSRQESEAVELAKNIAERLKIVGLLAVELFLSKDGQMMVNEVAPRPHNSGHHTIEACITSQYQMHLRAILDLPLSSTELLHPAVMVNVLGAAGHTGPAEYNHIEECMALDGVYIHLYGKKDTKPYRKMGHVTVVDKNLDNAKNKASFVQKTLTVTT